MASAATLSPADSEKLSKLQAAVSGLTQIRYGNVDVNPFVFVYLWHFFIWCDLDLWDLFDKWVVGCDICFV